MTAHGRAKRRALTKNRSASVTLLGFDERTIARKESSAFSNTFTKLRVEVANLSPLTLARKSASASERSLFASRMDSAPAASISSTSLLRSSSLLRQEKLTSLKSRRKRLKNLILSSAHRCTRSTISSMNIVNTTKVSKRTHLKVNKLGARWGASHHCYCCRRSRVFHFRPTRLARSPAPHVRDPVPASVATAVSLPT